MFASGDTQSDARRSARKNPKIFAGWTRIFGLLLALLIAGDQARCLESYECRDGEILCDLQAYLAVYALLNSCSTTSFSTYQGGAGADRVKHIIQTANFGYVAVGSADQSFGAPLNPHSGGTDQWIARFDQNGNLLWHTFFGSAGADAAEHVLELADGSLMVSGFAAGSFGAPINAHAGAADMTLMKLNANGGLIWNTFFGTAMADGGGEAILRPDGLIWYLGVSAGSLVGNAGTIISGVPGGSRMGAAILIDANGAPSLYGLLGPGAGTAEFRSGAATDTGIIIVGQSTAGFGTPINGHSGGGDDDIYLQALTNEASPQLGGSTFLGAGGADVSQDVVELSTKEVLIVGRSAATTGAPINAHSGGADMTVVKLTASGVYSYHTYLGQAGTDRAFGTAEITNAPQDTGLNGSLIVAGHSDATWGSPLKPHIGGDDFTLARLTASGTLTTNSFYGSSGIDQAFAMTATCDGGVVMAGVSAGEFSGVGVPVNAHSAGTEDAAILKLAPGEF
ncbi:MAG: hypothetical protein NXI24_07520 [bacterium]|nr:hypothetical protein [bacterium]